MNRQFSNLVFYKQNNEDRSYDGNNETCCLVFSPRSIQDSNGKEDMNFKLIDSLLDDTYE